uniref:Ecotropic viral integration site 2A n=1 Tax=Anas platyrhynchos platyrhynchos TaxID=8840 RepID=A0A493TW60_ANAPP|eukprot:XP_005021066.2 protein EVI2A isoform X2 [Anas platyrhynchos]
MKTKIHSKQHFAFPVVIIFALCLQVNANHTEYPGVINETWNPISQNLSGSQNIMEANTNPPTTINFNGKAMTTEMQTATPQSLSSTMGQNSSISSSSRSTVSAAGGPKNTSKPKTTWSKEMCEDIVIANKMSYLKKAQQGKRRPRSNGDILATNSLWPTAAGTWQKMPKEEAGTDLIMQELLAGRDAAIQRKTQDQTTERITRETDKHENEELKSHKNILTNFVVEI